jgi:hypothetical protein
MLSSTVLSVGYEHELLQLRSLLLRQVLGVDVLEAFDLESALAIARERVPIALIVLCHTVPMPHASLIIDAVREGNADIPALSIYAGMWAPVTAGKPVSNRPEQLLASIEEALTSQRKAAVGTRNDGNANQTSFLIQKQACK